MRIQLEKRLARLEKRVAEKTKASVRNCRLTTRFHNAACLAAILKGTSRFCPVHEFRELAFFFWVPRQSGLQKEDNQFCPCPPHPWRSFVLSQGPHTWEAHHAAMEAWHKLPPDPTFDFQADNRRIDAIVNEYDAERQKWLDTSGRQLPSQEELRKLVWKRARKHDGQDARTSM